VSGRENHDCRTTKHQQISQTLYTHQNKTSEYRWASIESTITILGMKTEEKAKNLIHSVVVDHYVDSRSLRFSNCYYYHCGFGGLGALKLTRAAMERPE
jgi:hypothetical protein